MKYNIIDKETGEIVGKVDIRLGNELDNKRIIETLERVGYRIEQAQ